MTDLEDVLSNLNRIKENHKEAIDFIKRLEKLFGSWDAGADNGAELCECGTFTNDKNHGVMVHQCIKCSILWDKENGLWTIEEIDNLFFNMTYRTKW